LTTTPGLFGPVREVAAGLFGLGHDLLFALNQIGHHGGVKNALALRRRRKLFRCAWRIPLPRQAVVPLRQRLCLALGSSLRPMSVPAVCPDSLATKFKRRNIMSSYKNNVRLEGNLGKDAEKKTTPNGDVVNFSIAVNEEWKDKDGAEHKNTDWFQIQVWGPLTKVAAHLKAGTPVIVEGKIKPETYTADGVEHKTFSIKADYIRKINYTKLEEDGAGTAAKSTRKRK
jgi:single-strand DNA-binding protein